MRDCDTAASPLASYTPDIPSAIDSLRDAFLEVVLQYTDAIPATIDELKGLFVSFIDRVLARVDLMEFDRAAIQRQQVSIVADVLKLISKEDDHHYKLRALCYLRLLGHEGRTFEEMGEELGICRAAVNACYRNLQRKTKLPGHGDKKPEARRKYARIRTGRKRIRPLWSGRSAWMSTPILALPAAV